MIHTLFVTLFFSHLGNGIAHCNSTSNEWEGVPACFTILASALVSNDTAIFFDTLHNSVVSPCNTHEIKHAFTLSNRLNI